jgi:maltooligosyltrehalose trehalohydrolase
MNDRPRDDWNDGPRLTADGAWFRVWAPKARSVEAAIERDGETAFHPLYLRADGMRLGFVAGAGAGTRYRFRLDGEASFPDPCSRFQPDGVHGPSELVDAAAFRWTDDAWPGLDRDRLVIYELHVGAYAPEGTFAALIGELPALRDLGVTALELMPVAEAPGRWGWGYDGVDLYAPSHNYGYPDDLRRLVDAAHAHGLGVLLDVVYNHFGPDGNYLRAFSDDYFSSRHMTPWGEAVNYDGPNSRRVREFVIGNALMWIRDFHVDGFRLDATHAIIDDSPVHLLAELSTTTRAATDRPIVLIAEDERNDVRLIRPVAEGGYGLDAVWADDFHHALRVRLTGQRESYFADFSGTAAEIGRAMASGFIYQGQDQPRTGEPRGTRTTDEPARAFVFCTQNHDQVGNRAFGERLDHLVGRDLAATAAATLLFAPETPLLWMGEEFAASSPFIYFTDHHPELGRLVTEGRRKEFEGFQEFRSAALDQVPDPQDPASFHRSKLDLRERTTGAATERLYRALLTLRRDDPVLRARDRARLRFSAIADDLLAVVRFDDDGGRLLLANFGPARAIRLADDALLQTLAGAPWRLLVSTAATEFGGYGARVGLPADPAATDATIALPTSSAAIFATPPLGPRAGG